jgi:hypothetical protein
VIIRCDPVDGQQWTDGLQHYSDDGMYCVNNRGQDLVVFVGPLPDKSHPGQQAEIDRLRIELQETYAGWSGSNSALAEQATEIERLQAEWRSEFNAAQQLRCEVQQLELLLDDARDNLRDLEAAARAFDHHCEGMKAAYLAVIKTFVEARS